MNIKYGCVMLRAIEKKDMYILKELLNNPAIEFMTTGGCFPISDFSQEKWFENYDNQKELRCMIDIKDNITIGTIGLVDIDWRNRNAVIYGKTLSRDLNNRIKGDYDDALSGIIKYAFDELNLNCIYGPAMEYNYLSRKCLEKHGFQREGILRQRVFKRGRYYNQIMYSLLKEDYVKRGEHDE